MKSILIIAPHEKIENVAKRVAKHYDDVDVSLGLLEDAVEIAREAERNGVEVIISRGGTAKIIKEAIPAMTVLEIPVSTYDLLYAINTAKNYGNRIYVVGFKNIIEGVELLGPILDVDIKTYLINNEEECEIYIKQLLESGEKIDALLGGTVAEKLSFKYNIPTVELETSADTIKSTIEEAKRIIIAKRIEKEKTEKLKAILHYITEGVITINRAGKIKTINRAAEKILNISANEILGKQINELIQDFDPIQILKNNEPKIGKLFQIGKVQILANSIPIVVNGQTIGAVTTFEDISKIQEYEQKIRTKLLSKGHIAKYHFSDIIGESIALSKAKEQAIKFAASDSTVLITGESGTGKEMFAHSIHLESERKNRPFVAINCSAIPPSLFESELFGYMDGAFTGAKRDGKLGLFAEAHGGTIFLDEIGEISIEQQTTLLRVLQERVIRPIGSNKIIPIDVRIIAATNRDLLKEVQKGNFRRDLYYRLNILKLNIPPLRERKEDIYILSKYFVNKFSLKYNKKIEITYDALNIMQQYTWPGNIRELENIIERLVILTDDVITKKQVEEFLFESTDNSYENFDSLEELKKRHILKVLSECEGNKTLAAERLGISRTHLWRILNNYKNN